MPETKYVLGAAGEAGEVGGTSNEGGNNGGGGSGVAGAGPGGLAGFGGAGLGGAGSGGGAQGGASAGQAGNAGSGGECAETCRAPNTLSQCQLGACSRKCLEGFQDCDHDLDESASNGCETSFSCSPITYLEANGPLYTPAFSKDGRFVAFISPATNLVQGDTNGVDDVFVLDRIDWSISRVSVASSTLAQADRASTGPQLSGDGRYVLFSSDATNLVANDTNADRDAFVHDRFTGVTERVSVRDLSGAQLSGSSYGFSISLDGRFVAFMSGAHDADTNTDPGAFVRDRASGGTRRASVPELVGYTTGHDVWIAGDGGSVFVALPSVYDEKKPYQASLLFSHSLAELFAPGPAKAAKPVEFEPRDAMLARSNVKTSADGSVISFMSERPDLVAGDSNDAIDVFVYDSANPEIVRVTPGNQRSDLGGISADGRFIVFSSQSTDLVANDTNGEMDSFVYDRQNSKVHRVSTPFAGGQANAFSGGPPSISPDGRYVAFESIVSSVVDGLSTRSRRIFIVELARYLNR